jgi:hypothetical protein
MRCLELFSPAAVLVLAVSLVPSLASAQDADTLTLSGTFEMDELREYGGTVGADLAGVYARDNAHWWSLTLHGVTYSHDYAFYEWYDELGVYHFEEEYITRVHATSLDFEFFGPDADILNAVIASQLTRGDLTGGACLELLNGIAYDWYDVGFHQFWSQWTLGLAPTDPAAGVWFFAIGWGGIRFAMDLYGYPVVEPGRYPSDHTLIYDFRPGNDGALLSWYDIVDIGSSEPPVPPPPPPTLSIADGSVREGKKGTRRLHLNVTLSWSSSDVVTVSYATADGTALANSDYTATSGTLTFQPGETGHTISVGIKGDLKSEPDEAFTVSLSGAVGATIADGVATATILNDD